MKRIVSIVLLFTLVAHLLGAYVYFAVRLSEIHREVKAKISQLPDEALTRLELSLTEYQTLSAEDGEINHRGKMYDIVRSQIDGDTIILYAWQDEAEDNLLSFLNELVTRTQKDKKPVPGSIVQWASFLFVPEQPLTLPFSDFLVQHHTLYCLNITSAFFSIESPPPRYA